MGQYNIDCRCIRRGNESTHVTCSPCTLSPREERRRVFGNEKVTNIGTSEMIILQQPRIGKSAELYTHMPSGMGWRNTKQRVLGMLCWASSSNGHCRHQHRSCVQIPSVERHAIVRMDCIVHTRFLSNLHCFPTSCRLSLPFLHLFLHILSAIGSP